jgi:hypothetical protein
VSASADLRREITPTAAADAYLLIHLDDLEFGEDILYAGAEELDADEYTFWCRKVAVDILAAAARCSRRVAITVDEVTADDWMPELAGQALTDWQLLHLEPDQISQTAKLFSAGQRVIVAGVTRHDCVQRAIAALRRGGIEVIAHEAAILPWTPAVLRAFVYPDQKR